MGFRRAVRESLQLSRAAPWHGFASRQRAHDPHALWITILIQCALGKGIVTVDPKLLLNRIALRVLKRRQQLGLSQRALSAKLGMASNGVARIESGESNLTVQTLCMVAEALGMEVEDLLVEES